MPFPKAVREEALVKSHRRCCVCHEFAGRAVNVHHIRQEADGGENTIKNAIVLCLRCHSEAGHFNPRHPIGTKYSPSELIRHRDEWLRQCEKKPYIPEETILTLSYKKRSITQELHIYRLLVRVSNNLEKAIEKWKLQLYFPSLIPVIANEFDRHERVLKDNQYSTMIEKSSESIIYPGEEINIIDNDELFNVEYHMNHDLYWNKRSDEWMLYWNLYSTNQSPLYGAITWSEIHCF
jgi:hypothetical protein